MASGYVDLPTTIGGARSFVNGSGYVDLPLASNVPRPEIQAILNLNPLHYIELRYKDDPFFGTLIYQDRAGTTPVTAVGQSIGWARNLGSAGGPTHSLHFASCSADANRPLYTATDGGDFRIVGAIGKELFAQGLANMTYPLTTFNNAKFLGNDGGASGSDDMVLNLVGSVGGLILIGILAPYQAGGPTNYEGLQLDVLASEARLAIDQDFIDNTIFQSIIMQYDTPLDDCLLYVAGVDKASSDPLTNIPTNLSLFSMAAASEEALWNGYQRNLVVFDRLLTPTEIATLTATVVP